MNRAQRCVVSRGAPADVIAPSPGQLFCETHDNSVAILLSYGTARVLLAGDAEAEEEYVVGPLPSVHLDGSHRDGREEAKAG